MSKIISNKTFSGHGTYKLQHDQNIIIFEAHGAWNEEASSTAIAEIRRIVDRLAGQSHAFIFDTTMVEGMTPASFELWSEGVAYWLENGFKALVRMDELESMHYKLYIEAFDIQLKELIPYFHAESKKQGLEWLQKLGYEGF